MHAAKKAFITRGIADFRATRFDTTAQAAVTDLVDRLRDLTSRCVNKTHVELFGSLVTGFCKPGCDADVSLTYRNFSPWLQGMAVIQDQDARRLTRVSREAGSMGMEQVRFINARIPVVQFVDPVSGIHCDLSIGNLGGVENSKILAAIHDFLPDFYGAYIHIVKEWAKKREIVYPDKQMFNSFTVTTMALMVLQELGLLPIFRPSGELGELTLPDVQQALSSFSLPSIYIGIADDDERLGEAMYYCFLRFAEYYSKFDFQNGTVSLMCPRRHRHVYNTIAQTHLELFRQRKRKEWTNYLADSAKDVARAMGEANEFPERAFEEGMQHEVIQRNAGTPFVVEDFVNYVNCGRRVPASRVSHVQKEFQRLYDVLRDEGNVSYDELFSVSDVVPLFRTSERWDGRVKLFDTKY